MLVDAFRRIDRARAAGMKLVIVGTHPVILEAMAAGNCVLVNDHRPNVETVGDAGVYFSGAGGVEALSAALESLLGDPARVSSYRQRARERAGR